MRLRWIVIRLCWPRSDIQGRQRKIEEAVRDDGLFGTAATELSVRAVRTAQRATHATLSLLRSCFHAEINPHRQEFVTS